MRLHFLLIALCWCFTPVAFAQQSFQIDEPGFQANAAAFLTKHCARCHGPDKAEGEFRIDQQLGLEFNRAAVSHKWDEVVNVLNSHEMPPEDEPQPEADEVAKLTDWVRAQQIRAEEFDRKDEVVLRRLNRNEYRNTIRDLVGIDVDVSAFPQDPSAAGFDNNGRALSASPLQVELYLAAARNILDEALVFGEQPKPIKWRFEPESGDSDSNRVRYGANNAIVNGGKNRRDGNTIIMHHNNWDRTAQARDFKVPRKGIYTIRIRAASRKPAREQVMAFATQALREQRKEEMEKHPERVKYIEKDLEHVAEHYRTSSHYQYGPGRLKLIVHLNGQPQVLGEFDVDAPVDDMKVYEFKVKMTKESAGISLDYAYEIPREIENFTIQTHDDFPRPEVILDWFEIEGPLYDAWPPRTHRQLLPTAAPEQETERRAFVESVIRRFMPRAYRRPVSQEEIDAKLALYDAAATSDRDEWAFYEQLKVPLTAILVSPHFLYLAEPSDAPGDNKLDAYEFASRLSYFLWSSMPDAELFRAASKGELSDPRMVIAQVDRMLADSKSQAFIENFAGQWLGLRDVGANPPAKDLYPRYNDHVERSIVKQSLALFDDVLRNDRDLIEFIDSDHEMLNEVLTRYYDLPTVQSDEFQRVALPSDSPRGGILSHASILTITSNGTRTSPVKRGTWILKTILGTDPGLPVANAGDIAPKVPGIDRATVRQRLEIHRELAQCARCHNKIDPLGFALENFDAAGRFRTQEGFGYQGRVQQNDPLIDASGMLPDGTMINGVDDLKAAIVRNDSKFVRCVTEKLFTYALGRELTRSDERMVNEAVETLNAAKQSGEARTLRTLIHFIATSQTFANR